MRSSQRLFEGVGDALESAGILTPTPPDRYGGRRLGTRVPEEVIQAIRDRANVVEVISEVVELRRAGASLKGLCPFHKEKTPSFHVSAARGTYHCFGCDAHGDSIGFVRETRNLDFVEALRFLGDKFGVPIPEVQMSSREEAEERERKERRQWLFKANEIAAAFFARSLDRPEGQEGREYLAHRGVGAEVVDGFSLGYADASWDSLCGELSRNGVPPKIVVESGLARVRPSGGHYDYFRRRLVCPVRDHLGRIVAFSARALDPEDEQRGKYVNSSESSIFKKGRTLFGLEQARAAIRHQGRAVLVEGNFDVLMLHQAGFCETVASMGTALTADQVRLLHRQTDVAVLLYDGDSAGRKSALKSAPLFADEGLMFRVVQLPDGVDPDDFVRAEGAEALGALIEGSLPGIEWAVRELLPPRGAPPEVKERAVAAAGRLVSRLVSPIARTEYRALAADLLGVQERDISRHFRGGGSTPAPAAATDRRPSAGRKRFLGPHLLRLLVGSPEVSAAQDPAEWRGLLAGEELIDACLACMEAARSGRTDLELAALEGLDPEVRIPASRALHESAPAPEGSPAAVIEDIRSKLSEEKRRKSRVSALRGHVDNAGANRQT